MQKFTYDMFGRPKAFVRSLSTDSFRERLFCVHACRLVAKFGSKALVIHRGSEKAEILKEARSVIFMA